MERVVLVDKAHLVLVALQSGREKLLVHPGAVGALKVVEINHRDLGRGIAADGPPRHVDGEEQVFGQVKLVQAGQGLAVGRDQKFDYLGFGAAAKSVTGSAS